jgi:hypothetical protein
MITLPNWENRPEITANLINPAFCSELIRECANAYKIETNENFPFALSVLVLPIILNSTIRERLPKTKAHTIHSWINSNGDLKIGLAQHVTNLLPFTKESIMFGIVHNSLSIDDLGNIEIKPRKGKLNTKNEEVSSCLNKAMLWGKLLSKSGNTLTIYSILGIKP